MPTDFVPVEEPPEIDPWIPDHDQDGPCRFETITKHVSTMHAVDANGNEAGIWDSVPSYQCSSCDGTFKTWDAAKAHFTTYV